MKNIYTIEHNNQEFNRNPENLTPSIVFKGTISYGPDPLDYIDIYGTTEERLIELGKEFKKIEPNAQLLYIWGPAHFFGIDRDDRTFVTTIYL